MHEDLNRVKKKPYIEMSEEPNRSDEVVSAEFWNGFVARNQSIIVDLMYGQLKSTVNCLTCGNISITFDPYLSLSLPIPRPQKLEVIFVPYMVHTPKTEESSAEVQAMSVFNFPMENDATVADLKDAFRTKYPYASKIHNDKLLVVTLKSGLVKDVF